jgi:hypothetical protein
MQHRVLACEAVATPTPLQFPDSELQQYRAPLNDRTQYHEKRWQLRKSVPTPLKRQRPFHNRCESVFAILQWSRDHPSTTKNCKKPPFFLWQSPHFPTSN